MKTLLGLAIATFLFVVAPAEAAKFADNQAGDCALNTYRITQRDCAGSGTGHQSYSTLQELMDAMATGEDVYVRSGTPWGDSTGIESPQSGTSSNWSTVEGCPASVCGTKETPILNPPSRFITIQNRQFVTIQNFKVSLCNGFTGTDSGITPYNSTDLYINDIEIDGCPATAPADGRGGGVYTWHPDPNQDTRVVFNDIWMHGIPGTNVPGFRQHGFYINSSGVTVQNSLIENICNASIHTYNRGNSSDKTIIRYNLIINDGIVPSHPTCSEQFSASMTAITMYGSNQLVYGNVVRDGIGNCMEFQDGNNALAFNNDCINNGTGANNAIIVGGGFSNAVLRNNNAVNSGGVLAQGSVSASSNNRCDNIAPHCNNTLTPGLTSSVDPSRLSTSGLINAGTSFIGSLPGGATITAPGNGNPDIGAKEAWTIASATTVNTSNFDVNLEAAFAPFTPTSGVSGWAMTVDSGAGPVSKTITAVVAQSASVYRVSCSGCMASGNTIKVSLAANTLRDTSAPVLGQPNFAISNFAVTNTLSGGGGLTVAVDKFRIRKWSADVLSSSEDNWLSTVNQALMTIRNDGASVAVGWQITANGGTPPLVGFLSDYCAVNTTSCTPSIEVSDSDAVNAVRYDGSNLGQPHGGPITATRLSNPEPTFITGGIVASTQGYPQPLLVDNSATEVQAMYYIKAGLPNGRVVCFRPRAASGYSLVHNQTACVTIGHPVASAQ